VLASTRKRILSGPRRRAAVSSPPVRAEHSARSGEYLRAGPKTSLGLAHAESYHDLRRRRRQSWIVLFQVITRWRKRLSRMGLVGVQAGIPWLVAHLIARDLLTFRGGSSTW
jgi:hypothetical protein